MSNKTAELVEAAIRAVFTERFHLGELDELYVAYASNEAWLVAMNPHTNWSTVTYVCQVGSDDDDMVFHRQGKVGDYPALLFVPLPSDEDFAAAEAEDAGLTVHAKVFGRGWKVVMRGLTPVQASHLSTHLREYQVLGVYAFAITKDMADPDEPSYTFDQG